MSSLQTTLAKSASISGSSLHTGEKVTLTVHPAPPGHGRKFKRKDLADEPIIDAKVENVKTVERSTTIAEGSVKVHTVEHVLSALSGMGVDNALIEMDANEPPIGDGSAQPYVELIKKAGIVEQPAQRAEFHVSETVFLETKGGSLMTIVPDSAFRISCTQVGPDGRFTQFYSTEITPAIYEKEIAPARTFVYYEDVKPLMDKGLIKGGSLENAVVVQGESVHSKEPMRFREEFARHKILDIVGDLALIGRPIKGHIIAVKPGHGANTDLARALSKQLARTAAMVPPTVTPKGGDILDVMDVMKVLPHRYPFLMVDRVVQLSEDRCTAIKSVSMNEPFFQGHFPGHPIMPGVLQLEAMAQAGSVLLFKHVNVTGKIGYFMSADSVKFRKPVVPGDTLFIEVELMQKKRAIMKARGRCLVNGEVVSEAEMMFGIVDS
ncbi:3-hydroxyacyl-[acyl-carrier-protein] dehydratase /UDP-3-O-[3-hydroxymyristoyl] N-acetylglucosamine deacetylase [Chthoniobacter flavus]|uniref:bifunctional UDP-3-O-[3-hydroxymyristoyl] N-acetylglucosamine deacetylase/3-hydroxyacyl-ACP dehydratase n=1 Tax=Chthoniobacter flavus TaxID=191863 RepID=UPI001050F44F|nr:bifunctional UDP-3-O-[3-hydroxymyristoyl] N-acetylglucosamine deacetylase/3-hydroxyacyl-ACP dehydratase [Chthoniobacter flavus]TCO91355.1 3-hydroxyacyl-[acyl-carrier-protein] dehydratase /UDP-3-O-[3-hydroxymyristoyl] N-acetylglucosamine deacetylase [Chthoniobacter flavus]